MHRCLFIVSLVFSLCGFAHIGSYEPITEFEEGTYLGEGNYVTNSGDQGSYSSYAQIYSDKWILAYVMNGNLLSYKADFQFHDYGFFSVSATKYSQDGKQTQYDGSGYCASVQCHILIDLGESLFEETITFASWKDRIYRLGSMITPNGEDESQIITWEEQLIKMDPEQAE